MSISKNILLAYELVRGYHWKFRGGKIDPKVQLFYN